MSIKYTVSALAIVLGLATPASAVTITSISGLWTELTSTGPGNAASTLNTSTLSWGLPPEGGAQSSYNFAGTSTPLETKVDEAFNLGTFTHSNNPIYDSREMLDSATLSLSFTIEGLDQTFRSVFNFEHEETPNNAATCADGGLTGSGINDNGCADRVTLSLNEAQTESFTVGYMEYVLDVTGFLTEGGLAKTFWTREKDDNSAVLQASYKLISDNTPPAPEPTPTNPSEVPLPASGLLLLGGLGAMYAKRRKA